MTDISIIVPVYNVEKLLPRCIESILAQTKKEIEIILVDDGSPDGSGAVCDEYAKKDGRIVVIHKENGGLTSAWKAGVEVSCGSYLGFVDSDDWIDCDMYEKLWESVERYDSDVAVCGLVFDYEDPSIPKRKEISGFTNEYYDRKSLEKLFPTLINDGSFFGRTLQPARVTKLYRRELVIKNMELCDRRVSVGEDLQLTLPVLADAKSISVVRDFYPYHYWYNQNSMTGKHDPDYLQKIKIMKERLQVISDEKGVYDFKPQLDNDFLGLAVIGLKNGVVRNQDGFKSAMEEIKKYCRDVQVRLALDTHTMDRLPISIQVFLWLMKHQCYRTCYMICRLFFRN
ncbi:MAG: glycosyltransferase family 2 protein [Lachnospiraceae bacterium]